MAKIVAITGCPAGVAHTQMAAEALRKTAVVMGHEIRVETHGAEGAKSPLSPEEIAAADVVLVASDVHVEMERFRGKPMVAVPVSDAIRKTRAVLDKALAELEEEAPPPAAPEPARAVRFLVGVTACPTGIAIRVEAPRSRPFRRAPAGAPVLTST